MRLIIAEVAWSVAVVEKPEDSRLSVDGKASLWKSNTHS